MTTTPAHGHSPGSLQPGATRPDVDHDERLQPPVDLEASSLALRKAWAMYIGLALLPPLAMIAVIFFLIFAGGRSGPSAVPRLDRSGWGWFLFGMVWISAWVPLSFYIRRRFWHSYYEGGVVEAENYVKGNMAIWVPLVIAGIIGFIGLALTRYVPNLFTSITAFLVFLTMYPNGHAMTRAVGDHDDSAVYEEPK